MYFPSSPSQIDLSWLSILLILIVSYIMYIRIDPVHWGPVLEGTLCVPWPCLRTVTECNRHYKSHIPGPWEHSHTKNTCEWPWQARWHWGPCWDLGSIHQYLVSFLFLDSRLGPISYMTFAIDQLDQQGHMLQISWGMVSTLRTLISYLFSWLMPP